MHVRVCACRALSRVAFDCEEAELVTRLPRTLITRLKDENPSVRRGAALALGSLPARLLHAAPLPDVLAALVTATTMEKVVSKRDAETRRNAVQGVVDVCDTVGLAVHGGSGLSQDQVTTVFNGLVKATEDYATDSRGDVGSWVRRGAVEGLLRFVAMVLRFPGQQLLAQGHGRHAASSGAGGHGAAAAGSHVGGATGADKSGVDKAGHDGHHHGVVDAAVAAARTAGADAASSSVATAATAAVFAVGSAEPEFVLSASGDRGRFLVKHASAVAMGVMQHGRPRADLPPYLPPLHWFTPAMSMALVSTTRGAAHTAVDSCVIFPHAHASMFAGRCS